MTILLVEDSSDDVFFMQRALKLSGRAPSVQVAEDGQIAIDYLSGEGPFANRAEFPLPVLILLDLRMPRVPGFEVLKWLRKTEEFSCLPVIILSSSREESDVKKAYALGANSFLVKTGDSNQLNDMVKTLLDYWLKFNQTPSSCVETSSH